MRGSPSSAVASPTSGRKTWLLAAVAVALLGVAIFFLASGNGQAQLAGRNAGTASTLKLADIPFDGAAAYEYLKQICALGPRPSGSAAMGKQQQLLVEHFQKLGGNVVRQEFRARHPLTGQAVPMTNLIVQWHADRKERILLCVHYDTRPYPDRDRRNPLGTFIGANDGASGVALLMELAKSMPKFTSRYGIDFLLVDGEELVFRDGDPYFLGSDFFARKYAAEPPPYKYVAGIVLDMVADADLQLPQEEHSITWRETKPLVDSIWAKAARLGVKEFVARRGQKVQDDHLKLRNVAGIPTLDIIDFDYPHWHTEADVPANCSALSLAKVGWVVQEWLKELK